jgi:hypothetical protein
LSVKFKKFRGLHSQLLKALIYFPYVAGFRKVGKKVGEGGCFEEGKKERVDI